MSFFKKNKSKSKKPEATNKAHKSELTKEIAEQDRERHLDLQLEELTARLNLNPDTAEDETELLLSKVEPPKLEEAEFLTESLEEFVTPNFSTTLSEKTNSIDVTETGQEGGAVDDASLRVEKQILASAIASKDASTSDAKPIPVIETAATAEKTFPNVEANISLSGPDRLDMGAMRLDFAKINADIQSGEEIYRRAQQRIEGLMGFVEKAEIDFSVLNRLEPENRRLKAKLRTSQGEVETIKGKLSLIEADLEDHQKRLEEKTSQYEQAHSKLVAAGSSLKEYERVLKTKKTETERYALAVERHKTALGVEGRENKVLREKIGKLSQMLEMRQAEYLEASKAVESLRSDCEDFRDQADTFRTEAQDLRIALNTAKRQNNTMKSEMQALHEDIKTFKTQYEFNVINREDQLTNLESQVALLTREVDTKTELVNSTTQDVATLRRIRNEQDIERDRLEKQLAAANDEIKDITAISQAKNSEQLNVLQNEVRDLQTEIARRDDVAQHSAKETSDLKRQLQFLEMERDRLQSRLDLQTAQLESAAKHNPENELKSQIHTLTEQLRIKDEIVKSAAQDVEKLRKEQEAQLRKQKQLEDLIHTQTFQLEAANKSVLESRQSENNLDQKYKNIAAALTLNQSRRRSEGDTDSPNVAPDISDEIETLSGEDIENRIMDYKFGIRKDIV